ncbi:MAG: serine/threonine-protein phosphatase, partial [Pseudonocardia sp.]|nr:serine/threonine-protein phosphatase [Pseudonocardia sp.]
MSGSRVDYANRAFRDLFGQVCEGVDVRALFGGLGDRFAAAAGRVATTRQPQRLQQEPFERMWPGEPASRLRYFDVFCSPAGRGGDGSSLVLVVIVEATERVGTHRELTERAYRQAVLAEATSAMHRSLEPSDELRALAQAAVPELADLAMVHLLAHPTAPGKPPPLPPVTHRVVVASSGERLNLPTPRRGLRWRREDALTRAIGAGMLVSGPFEAGSPPPWPEQAGTTALIEAGLHTLAAAPVVVDDQVVAAVLFGCLAGRPPWKAEDLAILGEIATKAGHALGHGLTYQQTRQSALTLQRSLLTEPPDIPGLEISVRYEPAGADEIGGDWYDAFILGPDNVAIAVGDVVGHDMTAAAAMGQLRSTLRGIAVDRAEHPSAVLNRLDAVTHQLSITPFASMIYGQLYRADQQWRLRWANAGHPPPLLLRRDHPPRWLDQVHGLVLGTGEPHPDRGDAKIDLDAGDILLIYTDGLVERRHQDIDAGMHELLNLADTAPADASL